MSLNRRDWSLLGAGAGVALLVLALVFFVPKLFHRGGDTPFGPVVSVQGDHLVVLYDDAAPSIAEGVVLDGPQFDGLRAAGRVSIRNVKSDLVARKKYGDLVKEAGGCPAVFALTKEGDLVATPVRLPEKEDQAVELCKKLLKDCPAPVPPATMSPVVDRGGPLAVGQDGTAFVEVDGHKRYLSARPDGAKMRALVPNRYADSHPTFPIPQWQTINRRNTLPWSFYGLDQNGFSSCVAQANTRALTSLRSWLGMKPVKLSPAYTYAHINGGRDAGAIISEGAESLEKDGTCPFDMLGQSPFYMRNLTPAMKEAAKRYKAADVYHVNTWEELGSALQTGRYVAVFGVQVGSSWGRFDRFGVCGHDRGPGNHALMADGIQLLPDGRWVLDVPNSWGENWGPWKNGRCYLDRNHLFANGDMPDCCVIRAATDDPNEPWDPPAWSGKKLMKAFGPEVALAP